MSFYESFYYLTRKVLKKDKNTSLKNIKYIRHSQHKKKKEN